jgi:two-component system phosphate regulon sensor histidine kinase PhoR
LIKEIFDLLDLEAEKHNTTLQIQTLHPQIFVEADKQKISQVLLTLFPMPFTMPTDRKQK